VKLLTSYIAIFMVILLFSYIFMFNIFRDVIVENYRVSTYNDSLRAANNVIRYIDEVNNCIRLFDS